MGAVKETHTPDILVAGNFPQVTGSVVITAGEGELSRGAVLGRVTADGKYRLCNKANADGSQSARVVLADAVDATQEASGAPVYLTGQFNEAAVSFGGDSEVDDHKEELRELGIFLTSASEQ